MTASNDQISADAGEFISFIAAEQAYCVDIAFVREIRRWSEVTALPNTDPSVLGVTNLRGAVIPIIDLARLLEFGEAAKNSRNVIVVIAIEDRLIGLLVDSVSEILSIQTDDIRPNPAVRGDTGKGFISGLVATDDDMLRVLDLSAIFAEKVGEAA